MNSTKYFSDGLLPDSYIETAFAILGKVQKGKLKSAMERTATEMWNAYERDYFRYTYKFEAYINNIALREEQKEFSLRNILKTAVEEYFMEVFHDNIYTFLEHYVREMLEESGIRNVNQKDIYGLIDYVDEEVYKICDLRRRVKAYIRKKEAC